MPSTDEPRLRRAAARLGLAVRRRVAVVHAPPGCGVSQTIATVLAASESPHLTVAPRVDDASAIARGFAERLAVRDPDVVRLLPAAALNARRHRDASRSIATWLAGRLHGPLTVVLDELHRLDAAGPGFAFLVELIDAAPPDVRWILGMRDLVGIPLARWLASGIADASTGPDAFGQPLDDVAATIEPLLDRADALAALAALPLPADVALPALPSFVRRLAHELRTHHPHVFGDEAGLALPEHWRSTIVERVAATSPSARVVGDIIVARALEAADRIAEALPFYRRAGASDDVARIVDRHGFNLLEAGAGDVVLAAIDALPPARRETIALALFFRAQDDEFRGRYDLSESWYEHALQLARDARARRHIEVRYAIAIGRRGREDGVARLEQVAQAGADDRWSIVAIASLAAAHAAAGRGDEAQAEMHRALRALPSADAIDAATIHQRAAYVFLATGATDLAVEHADAAARSAQSTANDDVLALARSVSYVVAASHRDDPTRALAALDAIGSAGRRLRNDFFRRFALIGRFLIAAEAADDDELARLETELASEELEASVNHVNQGLLPAKAMLCAWSGRYDVAWQIIRAGDVSDATLDGLLRRAERTLYAALAGAVDDARDGLAALEAAFADDPAPADVDVVRAALVAALAALIAGDERATRRLLAAARGGVALWPRWNAFVRLVDALTDGASLVPEATLDLLRELHAAGLGGYARLVERAPAAVFRVPALA